MYVNACVSIRMHEFSFLIYLDDFSCIRLTFLYVSVCWVKVLMSNLQSRVDSLNPDRIYQLYIHTVMHIHELRQRNERWALPYPVTHREKVRGRGVTREVIAQIDVCGRDCEDAPLEAQNPRPRLLLRRGWTRLRAWRRLVKVTIICIIAILIVICFILSLPAVSVIG